MKLGSSSLRDLARITDAESQRASSWDRSGGNDDRLHIPAGATATLMEHDGPGCVTHIWTTISSRDPFHLRKLVLRMYWDGSTTPNVEVPVGDFFGLGHAQRAYFVSLPLQFFDRGLNCWFPMPFSRSARITVTNETEDEAIYYYYVDFETYDSLQDDATLGRFHAQWRRENPTLVTEPDGWGERAGRRDRLNTTGTVSYTHLTLPTILRV